MPNLIDSDWVIDYQEENPDALALLSHLAIDGISISIITYLEVRQGVLRSANTAASERKFHAFLQGVPILPLSLAVADRCAELRERLRQQGRRVNARAFDLINAATALEHNLTLVTRNTRDYADIPGLTLYKPPQRP